MATQTTYYNLTKPATTDRANIIVLNDNFDTIDATMKSIEDKADQAQSDLSTLSDTVGGHSTTIASLSSSMGTLSGQVGTNYGTMMTQDWNLLYSIAGNYSTSQSYSVGDYTMYEFKLYRCIADTTGDWDSTAWEQTTIIDIIRGL